MTEHITPTSRGSMAYRLASVCAALSLGAAAIHAWIVPEHLHEGPLFGAFFIVVATGQAVWAVGVVLRPLRTTYLVGALGSLLLIGLWAVSRTAGLPIGHHRWEAEPVGALDAACAMLEAGIVTLALVALRSPTHGRKPPQAAGSGNETHRVQGLPAQRSCEGGAMPPSHPVASAHGQTAARSGLPHRRPS